MIFLVKAILAHLIGDFVLQSKSWVEHKEKHHWKSPFLYVHGAIHFILLMLLLFDWKALLPAAIIAISHLLIDGIKLQFQRNSTNRTWFFIDQGLHLLVLITVAFYFKNLDTDLFGFWQNQYWYLIAGIVFLSRPSAIIISKFLSKWAPDQDDTPPESLSGAGQIIGVLERLFVFVFILSGQWQAVGFLLAAKSIFRFGDLTRSKDRKLTEYILIGTLLSFGFAVAVAIFTIKFLSP